MKQLKLSDFQMNTEYVDAIANCLNLSHSEITGISFEACEFKNIDFSYANLNRSKFIDCVFSHCNLSNLNLNYATFNHVEFKECKLLGLNWTQAYWSNITLPCTLNFFQCDLSHSSFFGLFINEIVMHGCKLHDVDFREAIMRHSDLSGSDLLGSFFQATDLKQANFLDAYNYSLSPITNKIKQAKFSMPDAINLLESFDVEIT